jgi:DNA-binding response OmpR family regulator
MTEGRYVLVVEDDDDLRELVLSNLEAGGFRTCWVRDGREALDFIAAAAFAPACILLDLGLPRLNGRAVIAVLREQARYATIPIVVITTSPPEDIQDLAAHMGVERVMHKPVDMAVLLDTVRQLAPA